MSLGSVFHFQFHCINNCPIFVCASFSLKTTDTQVKPVVAHGHGVYNSSK